jgi:Tol biopolymer transport system component
MEDDALSMIILRPHDLLGYSLRAVARHQLGQYERAIDDYDSAIRLTTRENPQYVELNTQRCDTLMAMGQYDRVIADARKCLEVAEGIIHLEFRIFCALTVLGNYEEANSLFERVTESDLEVRDKFTDWSKKYVFDRLQENRLWHPPGSEPEGEAFLSMLDAQRTYHNLSAKARRVVTDAFTAHWSPDGTKLAFSTGFHGYSGVAVWDAGTRQTDLLIVPGKDPEWSPDGCYLAFVRDCQALPLSDLAYAERMSRHRPREDEEVWIMKADGTEPRRLTSGRWPCWSHDPNHIYFYSLNDSTICKMSIEDTDARSQRILKCTDRLPEISPDKNYVACAEGRSLRVVELASGSLFTELKFALGFQGKAWSSDSRELCFGAGKFEEIPSGLWVHNLHEKQTTKVLEGPIQPRSLAPDGTKLVVNLASPYFEIWMADLDPNTSIVESLGPGQTIEECYEQHYREQLASYTRRIEAYPEDANNHFFRARIYDQAGEREKAHSEMIQYAAIASRERSSDFQFGTPKNLGPIVNTSANESHPLPSADGLSLFFKRRNPEGYSEIWRSTREMKIATWKVAQRLASFELDALVDGITPADKFEPDTLIAGVTTTDGLELYSHRPGEYGRSDIFVSKREAVDDDWGDPANLGPAVNSPATEMSPAISPNGLELYFSDFYNAIRPGGCGGADLWVTKRTARDDPWSEPVNLGPTINSAFNDARPSLSTDGLLLFFDSIRPGGYGRDIWVTRRVAVDAPWEKPVNLGPIVNTPGPEYYPHLSTDGSTLYWGSDRPGGYGDRDIWQVSILRKEHEAPADPSMQKQKEQAR